MKVYIVMVNNLVSKVFKNQMDVIKYFNDYNTTYHATRIDFDGMCSQFADGRILKIKEYDVE